MKKTINLASSIIIVYFVFGGLMYLAGASTNKKGALKIVSYPFSLTYESARSLKGELLGLNEPILHDPENFFNFQSHGDFAEYFKDTIVLEYSVSSGFGENSTHYWYNSIITSEGIVNKQILKLNGHTINSQNPFKFSWSQDNDRTISTGRTRPKHSIFKENDIIFNVKHGPLFNYSREGLLNWINSDYIFHHSQELDINGNIWACGIIPPTQKADNYDQYGSIPFSIVLVDSETGKTIYAESIDSIINRSPELDRKSKLIKLNRPENLDLWHLNDVEPHPFNDEIIALSLRNINAIVIYNYKTKKVLKTVSDQSLMQHDVDFINDSTIAVFSNNTNSINDYYNSINIIDLSTGKCLDSLLFNEFEKNQINTSHQGLFSISDSLVMVEETQSSKIWFFSTTSSSTLLEIKIKSGDLGHEFLNWSRVRQQ
ncbi:MAG: Uncharacterised protein [Flavobacteriaceae bacterium]|nr:MAG: Uncharacterised protein [Flavobacteriaceae bacterium]